MSYVDGKDTNVRISPPNAIVSCSRDCGARYTEWRRKEGDLRPVGTYIYQVRKEGGRLECRRDQQTELGRGRRGGRLASHGDLYIPSEEGRRAT